MEPDIIGGQDPLCVVFDMLVERLSNIEKNQQDIMCVQKDIDMYQSPLGSVIPGQLYSVPNLNIRKCFYPLEVQYPFMANFLIIDVPRHHSSQGEYGPLGGMIPHDFTILLDYTRNEKQKHKWSHVRNGLEKDIIGVHDFNAIQQAYTHYMQLQHSADLPERDTSGLGPPYNVMCKSIHQCVPPIHLPSCIPWNSQLCIDEVLYGMYLCHLFPYVSQVGDEEIVLDLKALSTAYGDAKIITFDILFDVLLQLSKHLNIFPTSGLSFVSLYSVPLRLQQLALAVVCQEDHHICSAWNMLTRSEQLRLKQVVRQQAPLHWSQRTYFLHHGKLKFTPLAL